MVDVPGSASGLLVRDCKGKEADTLVDLGVVSLVAERRGHERQAAEELGQWKTRPRRLPWPCSQGVGRAGPGDHGLLTGSRATGSTLPPTIALEISSGNARVAALQERWDRLRARLDLILDQRGADMADLPRGASGLLVRDSKGKARTSRGRFTSSVRIPAIHTPVPGAGSVPSRRGRSAQRSSQRQTGKDIPWRPEPWPCAHWRGPSRDSCRG